MKSKAAICALVALSLTSGGVSFAQGNSDHNDRGRNEHTQRAQQQDNRSNQSNQWNRGNDAQHRGERGAGPNQSFYRGQRLPPEYRGHQYVVEDWRGHHLNAPPRGYHWVQNGGDYILVAITTGIIMDLLLNH